MLYTADHHVYELPPLLEWNVRHTGTVPCDSWSVTAVYRPEMAPVLKMAAGFAAVEDGQTQLRGIVDEYSVELDQNGLTVTLAGRGYAARLLDNESRPVTYERVTLRELLRRHAEPYGITVGEAVELSSAAPYTRPGQAAANGRSFRSSAGFTVAFYPGFPRRESCWQHRSRRGGSWCWMKAALFGAAGCGRTTTASSRRRWSLTSGRISATPCETRR